MLQDLNDKSKYRARTPILSLWLGYRELYDDIEGEVFRT